MKSILGVIPARMASSRFPGKPLEKILGVPMLAHCYERALLSKTCDTIVVSTPDQEIMDWAFNHKIPSVLTSHHHQRATERTKETFDILSREGKEHDLIFLLQGDEPQIFPEDLINIKTAFTSSMNKVINLVYPIEGEGASDPNLVKVIMDSDSNILYFTRASVPHNSTKAIRQLGMIGFTRDALAEYINLQATQLEELESIDMMRFIENDYQIKGVISSSLILGIDRPEDIQKVEMIMSQDNLVKTYKKKYI